MMISQNVSLSSWPVTWPAALQSRITQYQCRLALQRLVELQAMSMESGLATAVDVGDVKHNEVPLVLLAQWSGKSCYQLDSKTMLT